MHRSVFPENRRVGFTLIELLVVIAIIGLLVAILLPAVQRARESGNRTMCVNHLKQIGLAISNYHDINGYIAMAGSGDSGNPPTIREDWGWTLDILPMLELQTLYDQPNDTTLRNTTVLAYNCPTRRAIKANTPRSDYGCNGGTRPSIDNYDGTIVRSPGSSKSFPNKHIGYRDITDGTSFTIFIGEKLVNVPTMFTGGNNDFSDNESLFGPGYADGDISRGCESVGGTWLTPIKDTYTPDANITDTELYYRFGSAHDTSANFVFADGSVRGIRFGIDPTIFMSACKRDDGTQIDTNEF